MAAATDPIPASTRASGDHEPYVPANDHRPEFTWSAVIAGTILGLVFGASSLYLVLKVGITVSASIPVAVLSITLFRALGKVFPALRTTILENNIVQTTGSAGESIAFGVGVTMPALMLLGFDMSISRIMVVSILGGLLGILMMIPLRRAFIVNLHPKGKTPQAGELLYPEGTACAEVLKTGEGGSSGGAMVFLGFGIAFAHKFITEGMNLLTSTVRVPLRAINSAATFAGEMASELLGVGYIIGFRTSSIMMAGAILGYLVIIPIISMVGAHAPGLVPPGTKPISDMTVKELRDNYLLFIGAGCVAAAGLISMCKTLPMIVRAIHEGVRTIRGTALETETISVPNRHEDDLSLRTVLVGSLVLLAILAAFLFPEVGPRGALLGSLLVLVFGFLFVTVSSRLTGEIGSTSNPISGMTVAALTMTCLIFYALGMASPMERILALSIGGVVCIAASNGGTTSQDLKTGFLLGATPRKQQYAILIGALTSAVVIGGTLILFNNAKTILSPKPEHFPPVSEKVLAKLMDPKNPAETKKQNGTTLYQWKPEGVRSADAPSSYWVQVFEEKVQPKEGEVNAEAKIVKVGRIRSIEGLDLSSKKIEDYKGQPYRLWYAIPPDFEGKPIRMLVTDNGELACRVDRSIMGQLTEREKDDGTIEKIKREFDAPKTQVMGLIINGVLGGNLNWSMVLIGAMIAITLELCGISSLTFAVGVYVPIQYSTPIFIGGAIRRLTEIISKPSEAEKPTDEATAIAKEETSPAVLLSSGYIAGGSIAGTLAAFIEFYEPLKKALDFSTAVTSQDAKDNFLLQWRYSIYPGAVDAGWELNTYWLPVFGFGVLAIVLILIGLRKRKAI